MWNAYEDRRKLDHDIDLPYVFEPVLCKSYFLASPSPSNKNDPSPSPPVKTRFQVRQVQQLNYSILFCSFPKAKGLESQSFQKRKSKSLKSVLKSGLELVTTQHCVTQENFLAGVIKLEKNLPAYNPFQWWAETSYFCS